MTAYASAAIDEFYDYDIDAVITRMGQDADKENLTEAIESLADSRHETAQAAHKNLYKREFSRKGDKNIITLEYSIPTDIGVEWATVSLSYSHDNCCQLVEFGVSDPPN